MPDREGEWTHGFVSCEHCGHRWMAVRPMDATALECPNCHAMSDGAAGMSHFEETDVPPEAHARIRERFLDLLAADEPDHPWLKSAAFPPRRWDIGT